MGELCLMTARNDWGLVRGYVADHYPLPSKDSYFQAFGPKDPIIYSLWAILMLRV